MLDKAETKTLGILSAIALIAGIIWAWKRWETNSYRAANPGWQDDERWAEEKAIPEVILYEE